jgi:GNAT superfamily N-acetyltransferase
MEIGDDTSVSSPSIVVRAVPAHGPEATRLLAEYAAERVARGRPYSPLERPPSGPMDSWVELHEMEPPGGAFLLVEEDGVAVACGGVRTLGPGLGEIKRMFVVPSERRRGHGRRLLAALEDAARALGHSRVRLDTSADLPEAVALYEACGYVEIPDYNGSRTANHWFEKRLG